MKRRALVTHGLTLSLAGLGFAAKAQVTSLNDAINKAGRQRMLSQRMAKSYIALGLGVVPDAATKTLAASMALFDRQLVELKAFSPTPEIKTTYAQLETQWSDYKTALVGEKPSQQGAAKVLTLSNAVLALAHLGTGQLEKTSNKPTGKLVNIAGRQRMLSQRMASHYLASSYFPSRWNVQAQSAKVEMIKARDEFVSALEVLRLAPEATSRIQQELLLADQQFVFFQAALRSVHTSADDQRPLVEVFQTSERILQVMDGITGLYAQMT